jgi:hypothetical protein
MKHICDDCDKWKEIEPIEDDINRDTYYICDECNDIRVDSLLE